jgi:MFS family permease
MTSPDKFYGWKLVGALWMLEFLNMGFPFYGGSVINTYMLRQIQMSRSIYGLGFTVLNICVGAPAFLIVASILRWGIKATFVIGSALICAGALWLSFFATQPWHYILGFGVFIGTGIGFGTIVPLSTAITRWFRRYRGRAMAIAFSASGFAGFVGAPALNHVLSFNGGDFKQAWRFVAGIALVSAVIAILFIKERPSDTGETVDGLPEDSETHSVKDRLTTPYPWTPAEAYRTKAYWLIMMGSVACQFPFFFFNAHWILHLKSRGIGEANGALAIGIFAMAGIFGRFIGGWLLENYAARFVFMLGISGYLVGSILGMQVTSTGFPIAVAASICYGLAFGCSWVSLHTITGNFYGIAAYPKLNGTMMFSSAFTCAPAGVIAGKLFDVYRSYTPALELNALISVIGIIALFFTTMPKPKSLYASVSSSLPHQTTGTATAAP